MTTAINTPLQDRPDVELDENSLSAIRSILTEEVIEEKSPMKIAAKLPRAVAGLKRKSDVLPVLEDPIDDPDAAAYAERALAPPKPVKRRFSLSRRTDGAKPKTAPRGGLWGKLTALVAGYRPTPAHIAIAALVLLVIMRPWLILGLIFITLFITVGVFLVVGYDGFWQGVMKAARWYANRRPERAVAMHARLDRFAMGWDAVLDRFPEGMVDALYLPDFGELATADRRHEEAIERRLAGMQGKGA